MNELLRWVAAEREGASHLMVGKEYMAPSQKVHSTPSRELKKSVMRCALRLHMLWHLGLHQRLQLE
jgi:hypothetical protein